MQRIYEIDIGIRRSKLMVTESEKLASVTDHIVNARTALMLMIALFKLVMTAVFMYAPARGSVAYLVSQGYSTNLMAAWSFIAAGVAVGGALFGRQHVGWRYSLLLLFTISPGLFFTWATFMNIAIVGVNATPMVILMDVQLYVVLTFLILVLSALLDVIGQPTRPKGG